MTGAPSEFARTVRLDEIGGSPRRLSLAAEAGERAALADRFALHGIARLEAQVALVRDGPTVLLEGSLVADVTQSCAATGAPVEAHVEEPLALRFEPAATVAQDEVELAEQDLDVMSYEGSAIDVGEAIAQSLALALDPFPRAPDAEQHLRQAGILAEEAARAANVSPLAAALRDKLGNS